MQAIRKSAQTPRLPHVRRLAAALLVLIAVWTPLHRSYAADRDRPATEEEALIRQWQAKMLDSIARTKRRQQKKLDEFAASHPAPPGSDKDFPYYLALYPMIDPVIGAHARPSLCIDPGGASAQLWCNEVGGPSIVRGDKIKIIIGSTTLVGCNARLTQADADLQDAIEGVSTWHRDKNVFYLGNMRFRIDPDPRSCGSGRMR